MMDYGSRDDDSIAIVVPMGTLTLGLDTPHLVSQRGSSITPYVQRKEGRMHRSKRRKAKKEEEAD
jgi:hypothetical protein